MVEKSTDETKYRPKGRACQLIWLQKSGTVNDQTFSSFAITPAKHQEVITTSSRSKDWLTESLEPNQKDNPLLFLGRTGHETTTSLTAFFAVSGFVLQFVGLRGMHWSASIGQLIATLTMTIIRVSIRKNLAVFPKSYSLHPEHELDWLALTLLSKDDDESCLLSSSSSSTSEEKPKDGHDVSWQKGTQGPDWMDALCLDEKLLFSTEDHKLMSTTYRQGLTTSTLNKVVQLRRDLGKLADWPGVASQEAISTARAIEIALDELSGTFEQDLGQDTGRFSWRMRIGNDWIDFHVERSGRNWKALADEIDAALSLWIYHIKFTKPSGPGIATELSTAEQDDSWLRTKGETPRRSLRLLGSSSKRLEQDLRWWVPDQEFLSVIQAETGIDAAKTSSDDFEYAIGCCEFTSEAQRLTFVPKDESGTQKPAAFAVETYDSLQTLLAQHMFTIFMFALANIMSKPIPGQATMKHDDPSNKVGSSRWNKFSLHHDAISSLAQKVQAVGFGNLESIYLSIIPPLSAANKLPEVETVVYWTQQHAAVHEHRGNWTDAVEAYRWLFGRARCFPERRILNIKATALLLAGRAHIRWLFETEKERLLEQRLHNQDLEKLLVELNNDWESEKPAGTPTDLDHFLGHFLDMRKLIVFGSIKPPKHLEASLRFGALHQKVMEDDPIISTEERRHINQQDILGLTPLHYAILYTVYPVVDSLAANGAEMNTTDIRGRTPLHHLCRSNHPTDDWMYVMLRWGVKIDVQDVDGLTPLHLAALHNLESHARLLLEAGANFNLADKAGYSPLLWAAHGGSRRVAEMLMELLGEKERDEKLGRIRDNHGRTALHVAAMSGQASFIEWLVSLHGLSTLVQTKDESGHTPIHLAAEAGKEDTVDQLLRLGSDPRVQDPAGTTPMHLAAVHGYTDIIRMLFDADGTEYLPEFKYGQTPLHVAVRVGDIDTVKLLVTKGISVNSVYSGRTALDFAVEDGHDEIIRFLLSRSDLRLKDEEGNTLLHSTAKKGRVQLFQLILDSWAEEIDINATNEDGNTPLHLAAEEGQSHMVNFLVEVGKCDKTPRNNDGDGPLEIAEYLGHQDVVDLLTRKFGVERRARAWSVESGEDEEDEEEEEEEDEVEDEEGGGPAERSS